ncbi:CHASE2 domain-containing protein [Rhizobium sp. TRM95796]|uniref:CHASE2 domain-containing protein n=1 Tax=Rhizobium sp. TRM95796 TaxID=2979862 RepID=UPI0021E7CE51|nr:adenylate/guanylate cyclase domain-containing protein [Rhizobium sp. TRM95796]MCV3766097.1 adenylate/guanylate cyclase domain-containing protein [Rhizobium sp. TRM95796]
MKTSLPVWCIVGLLSISALWAGYLSLTHVDGAASFVDKMETALLDARIHVIGGRPAPAEVAIVAIDDATVAAAGRYPLDRRQLAQVIDGVRLAGATAIAIDMLLVGPTQDDADRALAASIGRLPVAIAGAAQFSDRRARASPMPAPSDILRPLPILAAAAQLGLVNVATDAGGTPRQIPMLFDVEPSPEASLALRAAALHTGAAPSLTADGVRIGARDTPLDLGWHLSLNYYGPGQTVRTISALRLMNGEDVRGDLEGRLVMLGVTATGVGDRFTTPFDQIMPGVEILATGVSNLIDGSALTRNATVRSIDAVSAVLVTVFGIALVTFLPLAAGSIAFAALLMAWLAVVTLAFGHFYWLSGALPVAASLPPVAATIILRQIFDRLELRRMTSARTALERFQASSLVRRIAEDPTFLLEPRELSAAILFVDLAGYTGVSERLGPRRTRDMLKTFHTIVVEEAERRGGVAMDFMGDGVMVAFGVPDQHPQDASNAILTAFSLVSAIRSWIADDRPGEPNVVRVGVHYGQVVLSRLGHDTHQQVAAIGDCVNVASRLQEVAKMRAASVALSAEVIRAAGVEGDLLTGGGQYERCEIRGRRQPLDVALWSADDAAARASPGPNPEQA